MMVHACTLIVNAICQRTRAYLEAHLRKGASPHFVPCVIYDRVYALARGSGVPGCVAQGFLGLFWLGLHLCVPWATGLLPTAHHSWCVPSHAWCGVVENRNIYVWWTEVITSLHMPHMFLVYAELHADDAWECARGSLKKIKRVRFCASEGTNSVLCWGTWRVSAREQQREGSSANLKFEAAWVQRVWAAWVQRAAGSECGLHGCNLQPVWAAWVQWVAGSECGLRGCSEYRLHGCIEQLTASVGCVGAVSVDWMGAASMGCMGWTPEKQ